MSRNDAQHAFLSLLEGLDPAMTKEIVVKEALYGSLNLAALTNAGFKHVETVRFAVAGELCDLTNVPASVTTLEVCDQRLSTLDHLPAKLVSLQVADNDLVHWSGKDTPHLQRLNICNNRLETLTDIPATLLELFCDDNVLKRLDLAPTIALVKLHCRNNPLLTIERLPPTVLADLEYDSTPFLDLTYQGDEEESKDMVVRKRNFTVRESLVRYFELKQEHEEDVRTRRRKVKNRALRKGLPLKEAIRLAQQSEKPRCLPCGGVDTVTFRRQKQHYVARCSKCDFHIDIFMGDHDSLTVLVEDFHEHIEESKQAIIEQKMQTLFGYLDKRHSVELFKHNMDLYKQVTENGQAFLAKYKHVYESAEKKAEEQRLLEHALGLDAKQAKLLERAKETGDQALFRQAMADHVREIVPAHRAHQRFTYPHMWVETGETSDTLVQQRTSLQDDDVVYGEKARVIHFSLQTQ
jgi:hypothetical protein